MSHKHEFIQVLSAEMNKHPNDLTAIRECLVNFKNNGMDKESMLESLEQLRSGSSSEEEDILLELMDFVVGYCSQNMSIY